jgi:hypothetical protein
MLESDHQALTQHRPAPIGGAISERAGLSAWRGGGNVWNEPRPREASGADLTFALVLTVEPQGERQIQSSTRIIILQVVLSRA